MIRNKIFGTPPEPVFNMKSAGMTPELLEEALYVLADENEKMMDRACDRQGFFKGGKTAEYIFLLCQEMKLQPEARFLAIELFEKFMVKHVCSLYELIRSSSEDNPNRDWKSVEDRIKMQLPLRAVSCVQLASKLTSHYKAISPGKARRFLNSIGHRYATASILKSEIRVLKTLDYHALVDSPLTYLETILEILGHNDSRAEVKLLHETGIKILDVVYLKYHDVYSKLCTAAMGEECNKEVDRRRVAVLASDHMLLAVAVIGAASYIVDQSKSDMVVEQLARVTQIPADDILDFSAIIIGQIL